MSISGKSDFSDFCEMFHTPEEVLDKYQVYYGDFILPLKIESKKDLVACYPYLMAMVYSNKEEGGVIRILHESFIDSEEKEHLGWRLESAIKYWKKCKRKKEKFDKNKALELISFPYDSPRKCDIEIVNRVAELGDKATIYDIHDPIHDQMRDEWYQLMIDNGWNENAAYRWVYGWKRYFDKLRKETNDNNSAN